jgi:GH43 family beta-xylosidase
MFVGQVRKRMTLKINYTEKTFSAPAPTISMSVECGNEGNIRNNTTNTTKQTTAAVKYTENLGKMTIRTGLLLIDLMGTAIGRCVFVVAVFLLYTQVHAIPSSGVSAVSQVNGQFPYNQSARSLFHPKVPCADPHVKRVYSQLYYLVCTGRNIVIYWSNSLTFNTADNMVAFDAWNQYQFHHIWAPELHRVNGYWFLYFSACKDIQCRVHRLYYARANLPANTNRIPPGTQWTVDPVQFNVNSAFWSQSWSIDPHIFMIGTRYYMVFSTFTAQTPNCCGSPDGAMCNYPDGRPCNDNDNMKPQKLALARLHENGKMLTTEPVIISAPDDGQKRYPYEWNRVNEAPTFVSSAGADGKRHISIIYSGGFVELDSYNLKQLSYRGPDLSDVNIRNQANWYKPFSNKLILQTSIRNSVYAPGHCSILTDESGALVIVYHARVEPSQTGTDRSRYPRAERILWTADGFMNVSNGEPKTMI